MINNHKVQHLSESHHCYFNNGSHCLIMEMIKGSEIGKEFNFESSNTPGYVWSNVCSLAYKSDESHTILQG